jgi:solute:Na+ symporter, SSS family
MAANLDVAIVFIYLLGMIVFGFWGKRRATTQSDFLVAGQRLGPMLYSGTMAAIVLGGASTIGGWAWATSTASRACGR